MRLLFFIRKSREDKNLSQKLKNILGFTPKNLGIYKNSLRHSSASYSCNGEILNNERLEFIGDSIISAIVSDILYKRFPRANEGKLSILRAAIVNRTSLNKVGSKIGLDQLMTFKSTDHSSMKNMTGNSFEALVGAVYYDRGFKYCIKFIAKIIDEQYDLKNLIKQNADHKSKLLQIMQKHKIDIEIFTFENCEANEKIQHFHCEICLNNLFIAEGKGWSKKEAEQNASHKAISYLKTLNYKLS